MKDQSLDILLERALNRAFRLLSFRARSEKEIRDNLIKKEFPEIIINQTIQQLKDMKYLNDQEFAQWWIEQRQTHRPKSKFVIRAELLQKGVDRDLIEKLLDKSQDDLESAKKLLAKKQRTFEKFSGDDYKKKASEFLQRRGFSWDIISKILKNEE